jgi:SNF family Na+-dependent transporter
LTARQLLSSAPREAWASRTGFVLASIGAAVGIGNIWRRGQRVLMLLVRFVIPAVLAVTLAMRAFHGM